MKWDKERRTRRWFWQPCPPCENKALLASADALLAAKAEILAKNKADVDAAVEAGIKGAFIDRLTLTEARLADMAEGLRAGGKAG